MAIKGMDATKPLLPREGSHLVPAPKCHPECPFTSPLAWERSLCCPVRATTLHSHHLGRPGMGGSITDTLQGHHSSCQSKDRRSLSLSPGGACSAEPHLPGSRPPWPVSPTAHPPSTAGSSFLLPSRKLPLPSQGWKSLTLRAASAPRRLGKQHSQAMHSQPSLVTPILPQSHLLAPLQSLSTSTLNRAPGLLLKHALQLCSELINS